MSSRRLVIAVLLALSAAGGGGAFAFAQEPPYPATASFVATDTDAWVAGGGGDTATISLGGTVGFSSNTSEPHDADFGPTAPVECRVGSEPIAPRLPQVADTLWSGSCSFAQPGYFRFVCTVHAGMAGEVRVAQADGTLPPVPVPPPPPPPPPAGSPPAPTTPVAPGAPAAIAGGVLATVALREPVFEFAARQRGRVLRGTIANAGAGATATIATSALRRDLSTTARRPRGRVVLRRLTRVAGAPGSVSFAVTLSPAAQRALARRKRLPVLVRASVRGALVAGGAVTRTRSVVMLPATSRAPAAATVDVRNNLFTPRATEIRAGGTVAWLWRSAPRPHDVSGPGFRSPIKSTGSYRRTFPRRGTFEYVCTLHEGMRGTITVR